MTLYLQVKNNNLKKMTICFYKKCKLCNSNILTFFLKVCFFFLFSSYVFIKKNKYEKASFRCEYLYYMVMSLKVNLLIVSSNVKDVHKINKKSCNKEKITFFNFLKKQVSDSYNNELHVIYTLLIVTPIC